MATADNLDCIKKRIEQAKSLYSLACDDVLLMAASKSQSITVIEEAIAAGITEFGENRVQEAEEKWQVIKPKHSNIRLHLIGALQTNKVRQALKVFEVIQSLDRVSLADSIYKELQLSQTLNSKLQTQELYIQINTGEEPQKAGVFPEEANGFIDYCVSKLKLPVVGLMCVPPENQPPAPHFALLRQIAMRNNLAKLSMGMSGDFAEAIRMGSSCVRIGSALFGDRI